jgi:hypothetical protein
MQTLWSVCTRGVYKPCNGHFIPGMCTDKLSGLCLKNTQATGSSKHLLSEINM